MQFAGISLLGKAWVVVVPASLVSRGTQRGASWGFPFGFFRGARSRASVWLRLRHSQLGDAPPPGVAKNGGKIPGSSRERESLKKGLELEQSVDRTASSQPWTSMAMRHLAEHLSKKNAKIWRRAISPKLASLVSKFESVSRKVCPCRGPSRGPGLFCSFCLRPNSPLGPCSTGRARVDLDNCSLAFSNDYAALVAGQHRVLCRVVFGGLGELAARSALDLQNQRDCQVYVADIGMHDDGRARLRKTLEPAHTLTDSEDARRSSGSS